MNYNKKWVLPFILFAILIVLITIGAYTDSIPKLFDNIPDSVGHFILYGLLSELLHLAMKRRKYFKIPIGPFIILAYAGIEEVFQILSPNRNFNLNDFYFDFAGILFFLLLDFLYVKFNHIDYSYLMRDFTEKNNEKKTAIVFGGSGLVGRSLINQLIEDPFYKEIKVFNRRQMVYNSPKIKQFNINFEHLETYSNEIKGDVLFCSLGTTIKNAGSRENFEFIDYVIPVRLAKIASDNGVSTFIAISSIGANRITKNFYLNVKGKMEKGISQFSIHRVAILRPSLLLGEREEKRFNEAVARIFMRFFKYFLIGDFRKYKPIHANTIAKAMIRIAAQPFERSTFESDEIKFIGS